MLSLSRNNGKTTSIIILVSYEIHIFIRVLSILLCLVVTSNYEVAHVNYVRISVIKIKIHSSCEIEYFVEIHLCKLCVILRSRVLRVVCPH